MDYIKQPGMKNPLSEEEIKYYKSKLEDRYTIGEQIGVSSEKTSTYLIHHKSGVPFVLKTPNDKKNAYWIDNQISQEKIRSHYLLGYEGNVVLPDMVELGRYYTVEPYCGEPLLAKTYDYVLSNEVKEKIAHDLGTFLNFLHQQKPQNKIGTLEICSPNSSYSLNEIFTYFKPHLSLEENKEWEKRIETFINRDTADEVATLTHGNICSQTVLYNPQTQNIAIIDWETFRSRAAYRDFVPTTSFDLSYHLLEKMTTAYNMDKKETDIKINLQKLFLFHMLTSYQEIGTRAIENENKSQPLNEPVQNILHRHIAPIEHAKQKLFEKTLS